MNYSTYRGLSETGTIVDPYQGFIATSRYARWLPDENRRETWAETVERYFAFMIKHLWENHQYTPDPKALSEIKAAVLNREVMPSMRALMTAGLAAERENLACFNCSAVAVDHPRVFDETMYVLMNGTGLGFSVESKHVDKLPPVADEFYETNTTIVVEDSKIGWSKALKELVSMLYTGQIPKFDLTKVRPAGARLKTFGGRASGPEPLLDCFKFFIRTFQRAQGRKLRPLEAHDLMCKIADVIVVGGVRRSALISLSDLHDKDMSTAKSGAWYELNGHRRLANNSAVYQQKPSIGTFLNEWSELYNSKSGERGIVNMESFKTHAPQRRDAEKIAATNPCGEIALRANGLCNLTEVIVYENDTEETLMNKVDLATILGTWQSTLTNFKYVRRIWKTNAEEERLLGVSLTGIFGNNLTNGTLGFEKLTDMQVNLKEVAFRANQKESKNIGINPSVAITTVKPSGTVSQLTGVSSGIHPWHSKFYARTVRGDNKDPVTRLLKDQGVKWEPDVSAPDSTSVFYFPIAAPADAITRNDLTAKQHMEIVKSYRQNYTEHQPSATITVREGEWIETANWVYKNWDSVAGLSFLPHSEHIYKQAPYQDLTEDEYNELVKVTPAEIAWGDLYFYEQTDSTTGTQELACSAAGGAGCEVVDLT